MKKLALLVAIVCVVGAYLSLDMDSTLMLASLHAQYDRHPVLAVLVFFVAFTGMAAFNLPGIGVMSIAAGVLFGFYLGASVVLIAAAIGATASMMMARTLLRDWAARRFSRVVARVNKGIEAEGTMYVFLLRMNPMIPFCVLNPAVGLTNMSLKRFYLATQFGMIPLVGLYVNLGSQMGSVDAMDISQLLSPAMITAFVLLALFSVLVKLGVDYFRYLRARTYS